MIRILLSLLIMVSFCCVGCKKKPAAEPSGSTTVQKEVKAEEVTKDNMQEELSKLENEIEEESLE